MSHTFLASIAESINRILKTPLVTRTMRPEFGSNLYLLRDKKYNNHWRLLATRFIYEAVNRYEPRVRVSLVDFKPNAVTGVVGIKITLDNGDIVEVNVND